MFKNNISIMAIMEVILYRFVTEFVAHKARCLWIINKTDFIDV